MNIIARHTLRSITKNPLQSLIIVFSIAIITACLLFAFCIRSMFYDMAALWAETHYYGSDLRLTMNVWSDAEEVFDVLDNAEGVTGYFGYGTIGGDSVRYGDETLASTLLWTNDVDKLNELSSANVLESCPKREGEISVSVSRNYARKLGVGLGDVVRYNVRNTALDYLGLGYVDVRITQICDSTGFYYANNVAEIALADYRDLPEEVTYVAYKLLYVYFDDPYAVVEGGKSAIQTVQDELSARVGSTVGSNREDGYTQNAIDTSVEGSMETLTIALVVVILLMSLLLYSSYSVVARNRSEELIKFKAAGATPLQSVFIMFAEVAVYLVVGCLAGVGAGVGIIQLLQNLLTSQIADATIAVAVWKYFASVGITALAALAACAVPAVRMSVKSVRALKAESVHVTRRVPWWVALMTTLIFIGALAGLFVASEDNLMPVMIFFLCATVAWAVAVVPHILRFAGFAIGKIVPTREGHIAAMEIPHNAGVNTVAVMLALLVAFVWTGACIVDIVKLTSTSSYDRFDAAFTIKTAALNKENSEAMLEKFLSIDGVTDGTYFTMLNVKHVDDAGGGERDYSATGYVIPDGRSLRFFTHDLDPKVAERFDAAERPVVLHYSFVQTNGLKVGDKVRICIGGAKGVGYLYGDFEIVGVDYTMTCYDYLLFMRSDNMIWENGASIDLTSDYWLDGDVDDFASIRDRIDEMGLTIFKTDNYYPTNSFNIVMSRILDMFVYMVFAVAAIGLVNLIGVTVSERKKELSVYRLAGMTAGGAVHMAFAESVLMAVVGFVAGLLFCLGINQTVPVLGLIVSRVLPRTLFDIDILYICLVGSGIVFLGWLLSSAVVAMWAAHRGNVRRSNGVMTD